jgi:hypothetical protein
MPIGILGEGRNFTTLNYTPKEGCTARTINLVRSDTALGQSKAKPLLLCDLGYWGQDTYELMVATVASALTRDWTSPYVAGNKRKGGQGITGKTWGDYRGDDYKDTVMIGIMLAKLTYGDAVGTTRPPTDYIVSAAPNVLFKSGYKNHPVRGDNDGTQIHFETSMAAQVKALILGLGNTRGFLASKLKCDTDLFIEKGSMCDACLGTWDKLKESYAGVEYRSI